jgi:phosphatidylserine/phosphatidylglycerophosphate/cardiolipin synthase-like enzyme
VTLLSPPLLAQIRKVAQELPPTILAVLVEWLSQSAIKPNSWQDELCQRLPNTQWRQEVINLLELWQTEGASTNGFGLAAALSAAAHCETAYRQELAVELVWTGPNPGGTPLRRTDQALLQLIQLAKRELLIVSFAVYDVPEIVEALKKALNRDVSLRIVAESPEASEGKISYGLAATFGHEMLEQAEVLVWPLDKRPKDREGRHGSLHAKCAVADSRWLLMSSANLTRYAMNLNLELGCLIYNSHLAAQLTHHINHLIHEGFLVPE